MTWYIFNVTVLQSGYTHIYVLTFVVSSWLCTSIDSFLFLAYLSPVEQMNTYPYIVVYFYNLMQIETSYVCLYCLVKWACMCTYTHMYIYKTLNFRFTNMEYFMTRNYANLAGVKNISKSIIITCNYTRFFEFV